MQTLFHLFYHSEMSPSYCSPYSYFNICPIIHNIQKVFCLSESIKSILLTLVLYPQFTFNSSGIISTSPDGSCKHQYCSSFSIPHCSHASSIREFQQPRWHLTSNYIFCGMITAHSTYIFNIRLKLCGPKCFLLYNELPSQQHLGHA